MMGKAFCIFRIEYFTINKSTLDELNVNWKNTCMDDLLLHCSKCTCNKNSILCGREKIDPVTKLPLENPIVLNFACIRFGYATA